MKAQVSPLQANPTQWLQSLDGRTSAAQQLRVRHDALCSDLGGYAKLSYQQKALIDRAIFLEYHLQQEELKLATGADFDSGKWTQACNALSGLFSKLGLHKQVKDVTTLSQYVQQAS